MSLRENYLHAVKQSQPVGRKELVSKSALGPNIYAIRNNAGEVVGYAPGEHLSPAEIEELRKPLGDGDPNAIFDSLFDFGDANAVEVMKSADDSDDPNTVLIGTFPTWLR